MKKIDARGLSCPQPVVLVHKAISGGETDFEILLDSEVSKENVIRTLDKFSFRSDIGRNGDDIVISAKK